MIISDLQSIGFTEYEARVYIAALRDNRVEKTAYEIAKISGVPRSNTYSALRSLSQKNVVLPVTENPVRYIANNPDVVLKNIQSQTNKVLNRISDNLSKLTEPAANDYVWLLNEKQNIKNAITDLIAQTEKSLWIKGSETVLMEHFGQLQKSVLGNNIDLTIILFGSDPARFQFNDRCRVFIHENYGKRIGTADNSITIVRDEEEVILVEKPDQASAAKTRNKPIVKMALSLMRHDYYMYEIINKFGSMIDAEFGEHLIKLREKIYTEEQLATFKKNMNQSA